MSRALVGFTGFVGSNLQRQVQFDARFNRANVNELTGAFFDEVVCAAAPAEKWRANKYPDEDLRNIEALVAALDKLSCDRFILISTIDVYDSPLHVDENSDTRYEVSHTYGRNRRLLELYAAERFRTIVIRLPALFGQGLKKNAIYDLLNENVVDQIHPDDEYQFYDVGRLWSDIQKGFSAEARLINIVSEPISMKTIAKAAFGRELAVPGRSPVRYDVRSLYSRLWGRDDGYMLGSDEVLSGIRSFVAPKKGDRD